MASRQSLRLLGLGPELQPFQDKCFICRSDLDIALVMRCHVMPCCGKFIHKRCFRKARETSFQCGHCRVGGEDEDTDEAINVDDDDDSREEQLRTNERLESSDDSPVWVTPPELRGPTQIERARNAITYFRNSALAHSLHQPGTRSWQSLPLRIDPLVWYLFWVNMDWFISTMPDGPRPLYIHATIYTPVEPVQHVRKTIYRLITQIIPSEVRSCLRQIKYRIRFRQAIEEVETFPYPFDPNEINFTQIRTTRLWSPPIYPADSPYTVQLDLTPATPPESPETSPDTSPER